MATRDSAATGGVLPAERAKASFDVGKLKDVVAGNRPSVREKFKHLFDGSEFDASMDDYLSYPDLCEAQLKRAAAAIKVVRDNPSLMVAHQAQKVAMAVSKFRHLAKISSDPSSLKNVYF